MVVRFRISFAACDWAARQRGSIVELGWAAMFPAMELLMLGLELSRTYAITRSGASVIPEPALSRGPLQQLHAQCPRPSLSKAPAIYRPKSNPSTLPGFGLLGRTSLTDTDTRTRHPLLFSHLPRSHYRILSSSRIAVRSHQRYDGNWHGSGDGLVLSQQRHGFAAQESCLLLRFRRGQLCLCSRTSHEAPSHTHGA